MDIITGIKVALLVQELLKKRDQRKLITAEQLNTLGVSGAQAREVTALLDKVEPEFIDSILTAIGSLFVRDDNDKEKHQDEEIEIYEEEVKNYQQNIEAYHKENRLLLEANHELIEESRKNKEKYARLVKINKYLNNHKD